MTFQLIGQQIEINNYQISQDGVVSIDFRIKQSHSSRERYDVLFYSSLDGYSVPIKYKVEDVKPGESQKATFSGEEQFGGYNGEFQIKLVAQATVFPIKISPINKGLKIGKSTNISWSDYHESGPYEVSLYQGLQLKSKLATGLASTQYVGKIPKSLKKGNYSILITPSNESFLSERYPVTLKKGANPLIFLGVAALAGGGAYLATSSGGETPATGLPDPPGPPEN